MHSILFSIDGFPIYSYGFVLSIAMISGIILAAQLGKDRGYDPLVVSDVGIWTVVFGLLGARLGYVIQNIDYFIDVPGQLLNFRTGGISIQGGIIFGFAATAWSFKRAGINPWNGLDVYAAPVLFGMAIGRIGCVLQGCCVGKICQVPWGLVYPASCHLGSLPRHPSQIYELFMDLAVMFLLIWLYRKANFAGQTFWAMISSYGIIRFTTEFFRDSNIHMGLSAAQWFSLIFFVIGLLGYLGKYGKAKIQIIPLPKKS